jgi:hypothetical protein
MMKTYILVNRVPIPTDDIDAWNKNLLQTRSIKYTEFGDRIVVSTVFLGLDHSNRHSKNTGPVLFETMVFGSKYDDYQERYQTYDDAVLGHDRICEMVDEVRINRDNKLNDLGI